MTNKDQITSQKSLIDLLKIQFLPTVKFTREEVIELLLSELHKVGIGKTTNLPKLKYFQHGFKLIALDRTKAIVGSIKWRGEHEYVQLELSGQGCAYFNQLDEKFEAIYNISESFKSQITEIDIAVDDFTGKYNGRQIDRDYSALKFKGERGKNPEIDKINRNGAKSTRIGTKNAMKQFLWYDKAREQSLDLSQQSFDSWSRLEVTLYRRTGHEIPLDVLMTPDKYFIGAYPKALRKIIKGVEPRSIKREITFLKVNDAAHSITAMIRQWGKAIGHFDELVGSSDTTVALLSRQGEFKKFNLPHFVDKQEFTQQLIARLQRAEVA